MAAPWTLHQLPAENHRLPPGADLSLRRAGELPMSGLMRPPGGRLAATRRLPHAVQQALDAQEYAALERANKVRAISFLTQVAMFEVAGLSNLEGELVRQVPLAERRLESLVNTATGALAAELARFAIGG